MQKIRKKKFCCEIQSANMVELILQSVAHNNFLGDFWKNPMELETF